MRVLQKIKESPKRYFFLLVLIIFANIITMFWWGYRKSNFYWDEFHTLKNAKDYLNYDAGRMEYVDTIFNSDKWYSVGEMRNIYVVSKEVSVARNIPQALKVAAKRDLYPLFLNVVESVFFPDLFSKWPGIFLNIFFLEITLVFIFLWVKEFADERVAIISVVAYGFSGFAISTACFIRQYSFSICLSVILVYLCTIIWREEKLYKLLIFEVLTWLCVYLVYRCNVLGAAYCGLIVIAVCIAGIICKKKRIFWIYTLPSLVLGLGFVFASGYPQLLWSYKEHMTEGNLSSAHVALLNSLMECSFGEYFHRVGKLFVDCINVTYLDVSTFLVLLIYVGINIVRKKREQIRQKYDDGRILQLGFIIASIGFGLIGCLFDFGLIRYFSWMFPVIIVMPIALVTETLGEMNWEHNSMFIYCVLGLICICQFFNPKIEHIYANDKEAKEYAASVEYPNVVIDDIAAITQNCIAFANADTQLLYSIDRLPQDSFLDNGFLLWIDDLNKHDSIKMELENREFTYDKKADTYVSEIYFVYK